MRKDPLHHPILAGAEERMDLRVAERRTSPAGHGTAERQVAHGEGIHERPIQIEQYGRERCGHRQMSVGAAGSRPRQWR